MNFFKKIFRLFSNNWWLKLIALLLAIIIYHGEKSDSNRNQDTKANDRPIIQIR